MKLYEMYYFAFNKSLEPMLFADLNTGRIFDVNQAFLDLLGYAKDEVMVKTAFELGLLPGEDSQPLSIKTKNGSLKSGMVSANDLVHKEKMMRLMVFQEQTENDHFSLEEMLTQTISLISKISEFRDPYTSGHQKRTQKLACAIASEMKLSGEAIHHLSMAAAIHDVGKIYISTDILNKPGMLTQLEYQMLQTHVDVGYEIIKDFKLPWQIPKIISQHHERLDGSGYPKGLTASQIFLESKILAVADVVDAMNSHRPYRPALGIEAALEEICHYKGEKYDSEVVEHCMRLFINKDFDFSFSG
ncbi:HD-GYP domain-containing protein [Desulfitobacterium chlororespirans]|uniref:PAS domain S-box-containing protein/HDIG domain-containing protein n=1 Tax=Desulfitobacterium chlororespirans DSM 11544 TaxID=1121395 RepID=A0A1M7SPB6_9FIRM|nr:HD domain-containing phosphohydrolase [Desulfitobacterium chlororespirans]SHN60341.1 PAS domain S-box-containing protein/HDIG domain-containing protein [Desulfitobacterium chlororespirans DSM 11544]